MAEEGEPVRQVNPVKGNYQQQQHIESLVQIISLVKLLSYRVHDERASLQVLRALVRESAHPRLSLADRQKHVGQVDRSKYPPQLSQQVLSLHLLAERLQLLPYS